MLICLSSPNLDGSFSLLTNLNDSLKLFLWKMVWNIILMKSRISQSITSSIDSSCPLCSNDDTYSLTHLLFSCNFARVVWRQSFWRIDYLALNVTNMTDWLLIILNPNHHLGIPTVETHVPDFLLQSHSHFNPSSISMKSELQNCYK
jgi:hypothetical protein